MLKKEEQLRIAFKTLIMELLEQSGDFNDLACEYSDKLLKEVRYYNKRR